MDGDAAGAREVHVPSAESEAALVQAAVERFVERHSCGDEVDLQQFVQVYPEALRQRIFAQCREFLAFDGLLGHQEWESPPVDDDGGRVFGDFVIQEELGRGGMGVVYLARQRSLNRRVALKVMASGLTLSKRHVERFRREAAAAAQLRHPAIVAVHSLVEVDGTFAIAMDYVAGRNLADILDDLRLANGPQPTAVEGTLGIEPHKGYVAECAMLCAQLASALASAHRQGVVHRDLKPRNLMIDERQEARLLDFGLAKSLGDGSISMSGEITGTVHYMSPEQTLAKRVPVDHRTDIFALGVILYELLTLRRPFDGKNMQQIVYEICFKEPVPPQRHNPKVPRDLVTVCLKALEKDPQNRYQSAEELEADLWRFLRWEPVHAKPAGALSRLGKWIHRHRTEAIAAALVAVTGAGSLGYLWYDGWLADREADRFVALAAAQSERGELEQALDSITKALGKRDDAQIRGRFDLYRQKLETAAKQTEAELARAASLRLSSNEQLAHNRQLAIQLALAAYDVRASADSKSAVLKALGAGFVSTPLDGHSGRLLCARWSPDGSAIATTGTERGPTPAQEAATAILWNPDGTQRHVLRGHAGWIVDAEFTPDGRLLATASVDRSVKLWSVATGALAGIWQHEVSVQSIVFDRDGARALTCGDANNGVYTAVVWDVAHGTRVSSLSAHRQYITAAALSPCGRYAATAGDRDFVRLWRTDDGGELTRLGGFSGLVSAVVFAPAGDLVAVGSQDGRIALHAVPGGELLAVVGHSHAVNGLAFDAEGQRLLSCSDDRTARLWRLERAPTGLAVREAEIFVGHRDAVTNAAFDRLGQLVVTAGRDGAMRVFDALGTELSAFEVGDVHLRDAAFDPAGQRVLCWSRRRALLWDFTDTRGVVTLRQPGLEVPAVCFDPDGGRVVTAGDDERLRAWNAHTGKLLWASQKLGNPLDAVDVDPTGGLVLASTVKGQVTVHRLSDGERLFELVGHGAEALPVARFAAGGARILTAGGDHRAIVWDAKDRSQVMVLELGHAIATADLARDGGLLATVERGDDKVVRLWAVPDRAPRGELRCAAAVRLLAFRPDGQALLLGDARGGLRIVDLGGAELRAFATKGAIEHATWSRDGTCVLASAAGDSSARLWNVATGEQQLTFSGHTNTVECNALSPDGQWAATASRDGTARIWPTDPVGVARRLPLPLLTADERQRYGLQR